ncbi:MAG: diaminopimelate decarboxylase [Anaerolineales bacterium]|nr:diaminopimelate decarboxylase [Anaerolineales bacterium]
MNELLQSRLEIFPVSSELVGSPGERQLYIGGCSLTALAEEFGTPLYIVDQATLDSNLAGYQGALQEYYPAASGITYAGKAYLSLAIAQWTQLQGLWLDCTGAGELAIAQAAGVNRSNILVHGVNKSQADLTAAFQVAGTLVVDNLTELERIASLARNWNGRVPDLWLRLRPGQAVETHKHTQTGQSNSKFGMSPDEIIRAVEAGLAQGLPLTGLHFHQGSHFHDPAPLDPAIQTGLDLLVELKKRSGWVPTSFCTGGGWGIPYHEQDLPHPQVGRYIQVIAESLVEGCARRGLALPRLQVEPGRSLVARAGVAIYQVGAVKENPERRWLLLDGGLADNPRPALYGAKYTALPLVNPERPAVRPAWLAGPFCESGDILIENLPLPELEAGEFLAVPAAGAYQLSMGSNYNGARKPAVVWLQGGRAQLIQKRETLEDLTRRDLRLTFPA